MYVCVCVCVYVCMCVGVCVCVCMCAVLLPQGWMAFPFQKARLLPSHLLIPERSNHDHCPDIPLNHHPPKVLPCLHEGMLGCNNLLLEVIPEEEAGIDVVFSCSHTFFFQHHSVVIHWRRGGGGGVHSFTM